VAIWVMPVYSLVR